MVPKLEADSTLRLYFLDQMPAEERERIDARIVADDRLFEQLCAYEDELVLDFLQGRLPPSQRSRFEEVYLKNPNRSPKVEAIQARLAGISVAAGRRGAVDALQPAAVGPKAKRYRWTPAWIGAPLAAAACVVWYVSVVSHSVKPSAAVAILLQTGPVRGAPENYNRMARPHSEVVFRIEEEAPAQTGNPSAGLRALDRLTAPAEFAVEAQTTSGRAVYLVRVPSESLPPGDYVLDIVARSPGGGRETIASRFIRVLSTNAP